MIMTGRGFCVKIQLHLHAVTCPGVWLCPNGKVALQINTLNYNIISQKMVPVFPLLFHEKFTFEKKFARVVTLAELQQSLEQELFYAKLVQWITPSSQGIILATFETNLVELLYPASCFKGVLAGVDIDLLMEPTKHFPGIIAPKIEVSTKTIIEGIINIDDTMSGINVINPKTISSKNKLCIHRKQPEKGIIRQKRVCHSHGRLKDQNCQLSQQKYNSTHNPHMLESCPVCIKYKCYFPNYNNTIDSIDSYDARYKKDFLNNNSISRCICQFTNKKDRGSAQTSNNTHTAQKESTLSMSGYNEKMQQNVNHTYSKLEHQEMKNFYKNLEKFYKRMYEQAKLHAEEINV